MPTKVTDPALLQQLNAGAPAAPAGRVKVTDPAVLAQLNGQGAAPDNLGDQSTLQPKAPLPQSLGDQLSAGFTSGVNAIPIAGPAILNGKGIDPSIQAMPVIGPIARGLSSMGGLEGLKAMLQGRTQADVAQTDQAQVQQNPVASGIGTVAGNVLPFMAGGEIPVIGKMLGMTGGLGERMMFGGLSGAALSGGDTLARGGSLEDAGQSLLTGGALGGAFPALGAGLRKLISPLAVPTALKGAVQTLDSEGVTLTAGQRAGSKPLRYIESELGGSAAENFAEKQGRQFTAAVLKRAGIAADSVEPAVMDKGFSDIGRQFDDLAARNTLLPDNRLMSDLRRVWIDYSGITAPSQRVPLVSQAITDIAKEAQTGSISGAFYKQMRNRLDRFARGTRDPELQMALRDVVTTLDQSMERSIAKANPGDLGAWKQARRFYRNMLVIEKAATGAGDQAAGGIITPARLRSAAIAQNRRSFARGHSDFTDLANAGVKAMTPLPQSGTAPRLAARGIPAAIGAAAGSPGGLPGAALGAIAGAAIPPLVGRAILSGPGRALLGNQLLAGPAGKALIAPAAIPLLTKKKPIQITVSGVGR